MLYTLKNTVDAGLSLQAIVDAAGKVLPEMATIEIDTDTGRIRNLVKKDGEVVIDDEGDGVFEDVYFPAPLTVRFKEPSVSLMAQYSERRMRQRTAKLERQGERFAALGFAPDELTIVSVQGADPMCDYGWPLAWLREDRAGSR